MTKVQVDDDAQVRGDEDELQVGGGPQERDEERGEPHDEHRDPHAPHAPPHGHGGHGGVQHRHQPPGRPSTQRQQ